MNKDVEAVLDYCQDDGEFDSFRDYILEHGPKALTREEFNTIEI